MSNNSQSLSIIHYDLQDSVDIENDLGFIF